MKNFKKIFLIFTIVFTLISNCMVFGSSLTIDQKIGMNGFVDCNLDNLKAGGTLREYHNFGWTYDANTGKCYFQSSWFDFDEFYKNVYNAGITILPCIQQGNNKQNREYKPVENGDSTTVAASYKIHSNVLFNYAARYGSTKVDESKLNLTSGTVAKTGLGYIKYYENWNEPDKTWIGDDACFSPEEFAAMCSADYDGHEGTMGDTYGIKQADPNAKLVYGGLAGGSAGVNYLERMKKWSEENRPSKTLPFDAINFHMYCGTKSPEASSFVESATALINWRNTNAPGKEIWITEFGWDTNTSSPRSAPSYDTQRDWIIREYLIADRIGLDRATVYTSRDDADSSNTTQYATCGLTTQKGKEERKSSWYGVNTLKTTLTGFTFNQVIKEDSNLYIYKYTNTTTNEDCYVLWCPTENGTTINNYNLTIGNRLNATLTKLEDKREIGVSTNLNIEENAVTVNVSESPIFVKVSGTKATNNDSTNEPENEPETPIDNSNKQNEETENNTNIDAADIEKENNNSNQQIKDENKNDNLIEEANSNNNNNNSSINNENTKSDNKDTQKDIDTSLNSNTSNSDNQNVSNIDEYTDNNLENNNDNNYSTSKNTNSNTNNDNKKSSTKSNQNTKSDDSKNNTLSNVKLPYTGKAQESTFVKLSCYIIIITSSAIIVLGLYRYKRI